MARVFLSLFIACLACAQAAHAYTFKPVFSGQKYAINEVVLDHNEQLDDMLKNKIMNEIKADNKGRDIWQSTTAVFTAGGSLKASRNNTQIVGVFDVRTYGETDNQAQFYNYQYATWIGIYITFESLGTIADNKTTFFLLEDLRRANLPLIIIDMPASKTGYDIKNNFFITGRNSAVIMDVMVLDSLYYRPEDYRKVKDNCKITMLTIMDRMQDDIPVFLSGHGSINKITCAEAAGESGEAAAPAPAPAQ